MEKILIIWTHAHSLSPLCIQICSSLLAPVVRNWRTLRLESSHRSLSQTCVLISSQVLIFLPVFTFSFALLSYQHPLMEASVCPCWLYWSGGNGWVCWSWWRSDPQVFHPDGSKAANSPLRPCPQLSVSHFGTAKSSLLQNKWCQNHFDCKKNLSKYF